MNEITKTTTQPASVRGDRFNPRTTNRLYWHLTALRNAYANAVHEIHEHKATLNSLVDYGCGNMPYRSLFDVKKYIAADFPGNELADVFVNVDGTLPLESRSCDVVLSSQVLEHVASVGTYLSESHRVLVDGGLLMLSTHGQWRYHPDPNDFWRWTCDGLKKVICTSRFEIVDFKGVMGPESTAIQLWQDAVSDRVPTWLRPAFYWYYQRKIRNADLRCSTRARDNDACVYVLVARKC